MSPVKCGRIASRASPHEIRGVKGESGRIVKHPSYRNPRMLFWFFRFSGNV